VTNIRITDDSVAEWMFCPYCGRKLDADQDADLIVRSDFGVDADASEAAGFDFDKSLSHCGYHVRLWVPSDGESAIE